MAHTVFLFHKISIYFNYIVQIFSESMCGVVYIQSRGQKDNFEFDINEVTPSLLKDVFELESLPYFLQTKANKKLVEIEKTALVLNEQYLINSPNHEVTKKNRRSRRSKRRQNRDGKFQGWLWSMAVWVVKFSSGGFKIRKILA